MNTNEALGKLLCFYKSLGVDFLSLKTKKQPVFREAELDSLEEQVKECKACELHKTRTHYVFGDGNGDLRLMFIGEAPGASEDAKGIPFVGRAGQLLDDLLKEAGLNRKEVYIANCLKCRPPNNRDPLEYELNACKGFLDKQIEIISPRVIVPLGKFALMQILGKDKKISQSRGKIFTHSYNSLILSKKFDATIIPTYHPAYLLRNPKAIAIFINDLKTIKHYLGT